MVRQTKARGCWVDEVAAGYPLSHGLVRAPTTLNDFFPLNERRKCTYHTASCRDVPAATNFGDESCWGNFWVQKMNAITSGSRLLVVNSSPLSCIVQVTNNILLPLRLFYKKSHS